MELLKNKLSLKLTLDSSGVTPSSLSIATSIIRAASQVCSTSGTSTTNHPSPLSNTTTLDQRLLSPKIPDESQSLPSIPDVSQTTPKASETTKDGSSLPKEPTEPKELSGNNSNSAVTRAPLLTSGEVSQIYLKSCSRKNFSSLLVKELFSEEVRKSSNVSGKLGKKQLDPNIIEYVKVTTFERWPLAQAEKMEKEWQECKAAIDESNRRLSRKVKKTKD